MVLADQLQTAARTRLRRRSYFARPYICRFSAFSRLICPSTGLVLQGSVKAARTAASSRRSPAAKPRSSLASADISQPSKVPAARFRTIVAKAPANIAARERSCADADRRAMNARSSGLSWSSGCVRSQAQRRTNGSFHRAWTDASARTAGVGPSTGSRTRRWVVQRATVWKLAVQAFEVSFRWIWTAFGSPSPSGAPDIPRTCRAGSASADAHGPERRRRRASARPSGGSSRASARSPWKEYPGTGTQLGRRNFDAYRPKIKKDLPQN